MTPVLSQGFEVQRHAAAHAAGREHDGLPFGMEHLPDGWTVDPLPVGRLERLAPDRRKRLTAWLGFDLIGVLTRARALRRTDVVYGHIESDFLAAALSLWLTRARRPFLVGQTIWLFGFIDERPRWWQTMMRALYRRVDLQVHNARPNYDKARQLFPGRAHRYVPFGVSPTFQEAEWRPGQGRPVALVVGNDRARDWTTLERGLRPLHDGGDCHVRVASLRQVPGMEWAHVEGVRGAVPLTDLYATSACLVVATTPDNLHASGITAILEAASVGLPVVATRCGGLDDYFDDDEILFVDPQDPAALEQAVRRLISEPDEARRRSAAAKARCISSGYDSRTYWSRVVEAVADVRSGRDEHDDPDILTRSPA